MEIILAKEKKDIELWDNFVIENPRGNHLVLSEWLNSFKSYGFENEIIIVKKNNIITGGYGAVIAKFSFFKFYIIPYGPIVEKGYENKLSELVEEAKKRAVSNSCCYFQVSIPKSDSEYLAPYSYPSDFNLDKKYKIGKLFKYVYSSDGANFINLKGFNDENTEELLMSFSSNTRRHINKVINNVDEVKYAKTHTEIKNAYELCVLNAEKSNYKIRNWNDINKSIINLINKNKGFFITAHKDNQVIASGFYISAGKHLTYLFGGTIKTSHNISGGYALHWEAMKFSLKNSYEWYNISLGGSKGVKEFKRKFNTKEIHYENAHYHLVLNPLKFKIFMLIEKRIKPYKSTIAKWLSALK